MTVNCNDIKYILYAAIFAFLIYRGTPFFCLLTVCHYRCQNSGNLYNQAVLALSCSCNDPISLPLNSPLFFFVLAEMLLLNLDDTLPRTRVNKLRHLFMRPPLFFFLHRLYSTRYIKLNILDGDSTARIDCESSRFLRIDFKAINHILAFPRRVPPTLSKQLISGNK